MQDANDNQVWEVRMAYKKGWELRTAYYDRLLRSVMDLIEGAVDMMKVDGLSEPSQSLKRALLEIEDAWAIVSLEKSSAWSDCNRDKEKEPWGTEGNMKR